MKVILSKICRWQTFQGLNGLQVVIRTRRCTAKDVGKEIGVPQGFLHENSSQRMWLITLLCARRCLPSWTMMGIQWALPVCWRKPNLVAATHTWPNNNTNSDQSWDFVHATQDSWAEHNQTVFTHLRLGLCYTRLFQWVNPDRVHQAQQIFKTNIKYINSSKD